VIYHGGQLLRHMAHFVDISLNIDTFHYTGIRYLLLALLG